MATQTHYTQNALWGGAHYSSSTTAPATALLSAVGWIVGTQTPVKYSALDYGTEIARTAITSATPIATLNTAASAGNGIFVVGPLTGSFAAGQWQISQSVKAVTAGGAMDGGFHYLFFKGSNPTGSGATVVNSIYATSSLVTNLATAAHQVCTTSYNPGAINLNNEYLFVACQWKITGAGGGTTHDCNIYVGAPSGSVLKTTDFTAPPPPEGYTGSYTQKQLLHQTSSWKWTTENLDNTNWSASGYDTSGWFGPHPAAIYQETTISPTWIWSTAVTGSMTYTASTHYFKTDIDLSDVTTPISGTYIFRHLVDDTLNIHINGTSSVYNFKIGASPANATFADGGTAVTDATASAWISLSGEYFRQGINHIACEVHQNQAGSSDMAFGLELSASIPSIYISTGSGEPPAPITFNYYTWTAGFFFP